MEDGRQLLFLARWRVGLAAAPTMNPHGRPNEEGKKKKKKKKKERKKEEGGTYGREEREERFKKFWAWAQKTHGPHRLPPLKEFRPRNSKQTGLRDQESK